MQSMFRLAQVSVVMEPLRMMVMMAPKPTPMPAITKAMKRYRAMGKPVSSAQRSLMPR